MADTVRAEPEIKPGDQPPVVVKKYANRRLYNTESSSYITLDNLAEMVRQGRDFVVSDAKSGEDITRGVLTQIIVEEEGKGSALLPTAFLRQLIGFYGDQMQSMVPRFLEQTTSALAHQQEQMRAAMQKTMGNLFPFGNMEESTAAEHGHDGAGAQSVHTVLSWRRRGDAEPPPADTRARNRRAAHRGGDVAARTGRREGRDATGQDLTSPARPAVTPPVRWR